MKALLGRLSSLAITSTARDTYWVFGSNLFTSFLAFLYTIFLARVLNPEGLGIFSAVIAYMLLVSDVGDFGIGSSLASFLPPLIKEKKTQSVYDFIKSAFYFQAVMMSVLSVVTLVFARPIALVILKSSNLDQLIMLAGLGIIVLMMLAFATGILTAEKKFKQLAIVMVISTFVKLLLVILFFVMQRLNLTMAVSIFAAAPLMSLAYYLIKNPPQFFTATFSINSLKKLLSFSVFLGLARVFSAVSDRLDAVMLIPLSSSYAAGIYQGAYKIASLYILLASSFSQVIAPRLAGMNLRDTGSYLKKITLVVGGLWLTMLVAYILAPLIVVVVIGEQYRESIGVFQALLLPMALFVGTIPAVNYLIYSLKKPFISTINTFIKLLLIFGGNLYFIPKYGSFGPVWTLTIAYASTFAIGTFSAWYFHQQLIKRLSLNRL